MSNKFFLFFRREAEERPEIIEVRHRIFNQIFYPFLLFGFFAVIMGSLQAFQQGQWIFTILYLGSYLIFAAAGFSGYRIPLVTRSLILVLLLFIFSILVLIRIGLSGIALELLLMACALSSVLLGRKAGLMLVGLGAFAMLIIGGGMVSGVFPIKEEQMLTSLSPLAWGTSLVVFGLVAVGLVALPQMFLARLKGSLELLEEHARKLEQSNVFLKETIKAREEAETALRKNEEKYRRIYNNILDVYYEASLDGTILEISPSIEKLSKYKRKELIGKSLYDVYTNPEERDIFIAALISEGSVNEYEIHLKDKDDVQRVCSINAIVLKDKNENPTQIIGIMRDISGRKQAEMEKMGLEERLVRSQKMESLGLLAGGVAHDLNNVLSGIVSYPDLLLMDLPEESPLRKPVLTIKSSGQKAAEIVQDLLALARRGVSTKEVLNLNDIILDYLKSPEYNKLLKYNPAVSVETDFVNELLNIKGSSIHLKKTIMNLVSNAAEAQPSGGKIILSTENKYIDVPIKGYEEIREGDFVVLKIADTGTGIAAEDLSRIFEPFYTKKVMGRSGTGLGMAVVWGSVQDHRGYINVESAEGKGTTFYLYFPVTREEITRDNDLISIEDYAGNKEKILIIDDIKEQREIAASILGRLNYSVQAVASGEEAIEYMKTNTADLLILDMIMDPGIDGLETFKKIVEYHPNQKAMIASGFSETDRVKEAIVLGVAQYIKKPYTLEKIGSAVKKVMK